MRELLLVHVAAGPDGCLTADELDGRCYVLCNVSMVKPDVAAVRLVTVETLPSFTAAQQTQFYYL